MNTDTVHMRAAVKLVQRGNRAIWAAIASGDVRAERAQDRTRSWVIDRESLLAWRDRTPGRVRASVPVHTIVPDADRLTYKGAGLLVGCAPNSIREALTRGDITGTAGVSGRAAAVDRASVLAWYADWKGKRYQRRLPPSAATRPPKGNIMRAVSACCLVPVAAIRAHNRTAPVSMARAIAMYALRESDYDCAEIGRYLVRDHSTVLHGCKVVEARDGWRDLAEQCAIRAHHEQASEDDLSAALARTMRASPPADARAVLAYVRCTLLSQTREAGPLCAHGLWLLATQERLYRLVVDRLTRSGYGPDAGRIEGQMARLGYRRAS